MSVLMFIVGIVLFMLIGYSLVRLAEGRRPLLIQEERIGYGLILGPTFVTMVSLFLERLNIITFTRSALGILGVILLIVIVLALKIRHHSLQGADRYIANESTTSRIKKLFIFLFVLSTVLKLFAGMYDLVSVPTYQDDSFNNWNLRGKIFYQTGRYETTIINGNSIVQGIEGVASYPPMVPLTKTIIATFVGGWEEWAINGIHIVWISGLILAFYGTVRRSMSREDSLLWTCILLSLPLVMIHAWVPYADMVVAGHLFLVIASLVRVAKEEDAEKVLSGWLIVGLTWGLLLFTKNEATVLMSPIIALLVSIGLYRQHRRNVSIKYSIMILVSVLAVLALPWILYKWKLGMTFGNAKSVSGNAVFFDVTAFKAIVWQITHEANFLLLPLVILMLVLSRGRACLTFPNVLILGCFLGIASLQIGIFSFIAALHNEAILQTGLNRGFLQIAPLAVWWIAREIDVQKAGV